MIFHMDLMDSFDGKRGLKDDSKQQKWGRHFCRPQEIVEDGQVLGTGIKS